MIEFSDELKREFGFDAFGRFADLARIIDGNRSGNTAFRILDIGGRGNPLKKFLPHDDIYYLDPNLNDSDPQFIQASALSIPAEDRFFDFVTSADVLEHIPAPDRNLFLTESIRVARKGVIHVAPFYSDAVKNAEIHVNDLYRSLFNEDHIWLIEHINNELPKLAEITEKLKEGGFDFKLFTNNDLSLWVQLYTVLFAISAFGNSNELQHNLNLFYNSNIYPFDSSDSTYRTGIVISLDESIRIPELRTGPLSPQIREDLYRELISVLFESSRIKQTQFYRLKKDREDCYREYDKLRKSKSFLLSRFLLRPWKIFSPEAIRKNLLK